MAKTPKLVMHHTPAAPPPAARAKFSWRRAGMRALIAAGCVLVVGGAVFLLLPHWISNAQGRSFVLQQLNKRMRVRLSVGDWSLGWFQSTQLKDVAITLPDGTPLFSSPRIRTELTLWGMLWGNYDVGTTTAESPHWTITRDADGTTSWNPFLYDAEGKATTPVRALQTLRGSLQWSSGTVTMISQATGQTLTYTDVGAAVTIASLDAPFHIQINAAGPQGTLSLNANAPAIRTWSVRTWAQTASACDFDASASSLPTAVACDFTGLDPQWEASIGPIVQNVRLSNHPAAAAEGSLVSASVGGGDTFVDAAMLLRPSTPRGPASLLLSSNSVTQHAAAALHVSAPLAKLLCRVNPVFAQLHSGDGLMEFSCGELFVPFEAPTAAQGSVRIAFPSLTFRSGGLVQELLHLAAAPATEPGEGVSGDLDTRAGALRIRIADGNLAYDHWTLLFAKRHRVTFEGAVSFQGDLHLMATVPASAGWGDSELGAVTAKLPITGTTDHPVVTTPG